MGSVPPACQKIVVDLKAHMPTFTFFCPSLPSSLLSKVLPRPLCFLPRLMQPSLWLTFYVLLHHPVNLQCCQQTCCLSHHSQHIAFSLRPFSCLFPTHTTATSWKLNSYSLHMVLLFPISPPLFLATHAQAQSFITSVSFHAPFVSYCHKKYLTFSQDAPYPWTIFSDPTCHTVTLYSSLFLLWFILSIGAPQGRLLPHL